MSARSYDVCAAVASDLTFDARVWKEVRSLTRAGHDVKLIGCAYELPSTRRRRADEIDVVEVPLGSRSGSISVRERATTLVRLWAEVLRTDARVYHSHNIHVGPAAWLASRLRRGRLVYDAHELYGEDTGSDIVNRLLRRASFELERFMVKRSDAVITTNPSRAAILSRRHGRESVHVLANVPALVEHVEALDPGYPEAPVLLYQGGIYPFGRAFAETIRALRLLDDVHLVIIGFGREGHLELVTQWAREAGVGERVHLLPPRPFDELVRTAAAADVGIVPIKPINLGSQTGDTNKLFEYLMAGLPVVASDLPEIRAVVTAGDPPVGELFDPDSPESIAAAVRRILDHPERRDGSRREARRLAVERFNWSAEEAKLLPLYDEVRKGRRRSVRPCRPRAHWRARALRERGAGAPSPAREDPEVPGRVGT